MTLHFVTKHLPAWLLLKVGTVNRCWLLASYNWIRLPSGQYSVTVQFLRVGSPNLVAGNPDWDYTYPVKDQPRKFRMYRRIKLRTLFRLLWLAILNKVKKMTPYRRHCQRWEGCVRCPLSKGRKRVVLARGKVPAPILFVGEAPGASEDVFGKPFWGPAGKLLDQIIERAMGDRRDYALTNLVACIPLDADGNKTQEPSKEAIEACGPRLREFVRLCKPELIVLVGKLAQQYVTGANRFLSDGELEWMEANESVVFTSIIHPAAILRMDVSQKGLAIQRSIVTISDAVDEL